MAGHGGNCEVLLLPNVGLHGNSHIAFADLNNEAVVEELSKWLHRKGLDKFAGEAPGKPSLNKS